MATQVNYSSLELIVAFLEFVNAIYLLANGLIYVPCSGEYFECAILLDRLYFGCVLNALGKSVPRHDVLWLDL